MNCSGAQALEHDLRATKFAIEVGKRSDTPRSGRAYELPSLAVSGTAWPVAEADSPLPGTTGIASREARLRRVESARAAWDLIPAGGTGADASGDLPWCHSGGGGGDCGRGYCWLWFWFRFGRTTSFTFSLWLRTDGHAPWGVLAWLVSDRRAKFDVGNWVPVLAGVTPSLVVGRIAAQALQAGHPTRVAATGIEEPDLAMLLGAELLGPRAVRCSG